uniref:Uncharacterized protein n=1 Tax=Glossina brevipalpis TaxID=37001 RepID=A0A1A9WSM2_9MUSC
MRAHFASDIPLSPDTDEYDIKEYSYQDSIRAHEDLKTRIMKFRNDSSNMMEVCEFIDDVLQKAEAEANRQQIAKNCKNLQQNKSKSQKPNFNGKMGNLARVFVVRVFDAICNCANNAAAAPMPKFKFRSSKRASTSGSSNNGKTNTDTMGGKSEKLIKSKKTDIEKEKKLEKIKSKTGNDKDFNIQESIELTEKH